MYGVSAGGGLSATIRLIKSKKEQLGSLQMLIITIIIIIRQLILTILWFCPPFCFLGDDVYGSINSTHVVSLVWLRAEG